MSARTGALRRRRKRSLGTRLRVMWVFIVAIVAAAVYAGYVLVTLPALRAGTVEVVSDGLTVSRREVLAAAQIDPRSNAWLLRTDAIARQIEAIPYVGTAVVRRVPPAHVAIVVTERAAAACVAAGARVATIDRARRVLQTGCARADLLRIGLPDVPLGTPGSTAAPSALAALLNDATTLAGAGVPVRRIDEDRFGQLSAREPNGIVLLFGGDADLAQKARLVDPVFSAAQHGRNIRAIDLRAPGTPTVVFR